MSVCKTLNISSILPIFTRELHMQNEERPYNLDAQVLAFILYMIFRNTGILFW